MSKQLAPLWPKHINTNQCYKKLLFDKLKIIQHIKETYAFSKKKKGKLYIRNLAARCVSC